MYFTVRLLLLGFKNIYYRSQSDMANTCNVLIIVFLFVQLDLKIV
jgi:hypothetical protein